MSNVFRSLLEERASIYIGCKSLGGKGSPLDLEM